MQAVAALVVPDELMLVDRVQYLNAMAELIQLRDKLAEIDLRRTRWRLAKRRQRLRERFPERYDPRQTAMFVDPN